MDIPQPKPAQVLRYAYLWADEHDAGREEGTKDRPVAIVMATTNANGVTMVAVVPITHTPPHAGTDAIEIPLPVKQSLSLDHERSWIVLDEINLFRWPGPDLRPAHTANPDTPLFGYLPSGFFRTVRDRVVASIKNGESRRVPRTE